MIERIQQAARSPRRILRFVDQLKANKQEITQADLTDAFEKLEAEEKRRLASHFCVLAAALQLHPYLQQIKLPPHYVENLLDEIRHYPKKAKIKKESIGNTAEAPNFFTQEQAMEDLAHLLIRLKSPQDRNLALSDYQSKQSCHPTSMQIDLDRKQQAKHAGLALVLGIIAAAATIAFLAIAAPIYAAVAGAIALAIITHALTQLGEAAQKRQPNEAAFDLHYAIDSRARKAARRPSVFNSPIDEQVELASYDTTLRPEAETTTASCGNQICSHGRSPTV
jgi:hypothetical protein